MPGDEPKRSVWPTIFAAVVLLAVIYGTAYWWLVKAFRPYQLIFTAPRTVASGEV